MRAAHHIPIGERIAPARFIMFGVLMAGVTAMAVAYGIDTPIGLLAGFDIGALAFVAATLPLLRVDADAMRRIAANNDANRAGLLGISILLWLIVLVAVGTLIARPEKPHWLDVALIVSTLLLAWTFANTVFTLHYAHLYYLQSGGHDRGGLQVPGVTEPNYWDFLYFAFTIGMIFSTSDVSIIGVHMRKVVLAHAMAAFIFNMGILAFTVNAIG